MARKRHDLDNLESIACNYGNRSWSLKIIDKTIDAITHIRIVCLECGSDLPRHGEHHYSLCEESIHFSNPPAT